jgi:parallel beta-helix repeat protein
MKNTAMRRIVAITAIAAGMPLVAIGVNGLTAGAKFTESPAPAPASPAKKTEIRIRTGTGTDIQRAIASLPEDGGRIMLSAGTFMVSEPLVIDRDGIEIVGDQELTILKLADRRDIPLLVIGQMDTPPKHIVSGVTVRKLILDGNRLAQDHECHGGPCDNGGLSFIRNNALTIRGAEDVRIQHVTTRFARSGGVVLEKNCRRITISDFISHDNHFDGFAAYETEESVFTRMHLHSNAAAGISADIRFNRNIISFARLENNGSQGIFMRDSNFNNFTSLTITGNGAQGIFIAQADDSLNTPCTGNVFSNLTVKNSKRAGLRVNDVSCIANTVASSSFIGNGEGGVSEASEKLIAQLGVEVQ